MPFLVWDSPSGRVVREIDKSILIVGRDAVADFQVAETSVSRRHALLELKGKTVRVTDLGSSSGTKINGARLQADMPSTLEIGDFLHLGRVVLSFHAHPPPVTKQEPTPATKRAAAAPPPRRARTAPPPAEKKPFPWMWVALGLAFVLVGAIGAVVALALVGGRDDEPSKDQPVAAKSTPEAKPPPAVVPEPQPEPEPEPVKAGSVRAPRNLLPPAKYAPIDQCPDLLVVDDRLYLPCKLVDWDAQVVEAIGADGRLYRVPSGRATRAADRADLGRRASLLRGRLEAGDLDGRLTLAQWCASRFIRRHARELVAEVLGQRPNDAVARALRDQLGDG
ncbi:MAG: FHA domain-containing protein [Planctomycetota bacterium]|nr:FHA domain-containing protein [Planctomycetota bacterium]